MRTIRWLFVAGILAVLAPAHGLAAKTKPLPDQGALPGYLERLERVVDLYMDSALGFTCEESVTYIGRFERRTDRYEYLYTYDDENGLVDRRMPRGKRGGSSEPGEGEIRHWAFERAYSWVLVFSPSRRERYRFQIVGEKKVFGRPAVGIRFEAVPPVEPGVNGFHGTAWIDEETSQILRVDAERAGGPAVGVTTSGNGARAFGMPGERYLTDFRIEKNGMRFPSKVTIVRSQVGVRGPTVGGEPAREVLRVEQVYTDYRFFGVRTTEEIRSRVAGD